MTPDEVRRGSAEHIFAFFGGNPPTVFVKKPYFQIPELQKRGYQNPYYKTNKI